MALDGKPTFVESAFLNQLKTLPVRLSGSRRLLMAADGRRSVTTVPGRTFTPQMLPVDDPPNAVPDIYRDRFERCFRDHYAQVLAFSMRRVCGREIAEDVVADAFAVAWRRRDRIPDPALPWLYAIAGHVIANQYRSTRRRHDLDLRLAHETGAVAPGPIPPSRSIAATPSRPPSLCSPSQSARSCA